MISRFTVTEDHLKLLRRAYVGWDGSEYGAPAIDCKRPYGNGNVERDIAEILGWEIADADEGPSEGQRIISAALHRETQTVLQIGLLMGTFAVGTYVLANRYDNRSWQQLVGG